MRILGIIGGLERHGGAELSFLALARGLARRGHEVDVVHFDPRGSLFDEFAAVCSSVQQISFERTRPRVELPVWPDLAYAAFPNAARFGADAAKAAGAPLVCRLNVPAPYGDLAEVRRLADRTDTFMAASRATGDDYVSSGLPAEKITVVYNGVDTEQFRDSDGRSARHALGIDEDAFVVLFAGRIDPSKGIETLLDAWRLCRRSDVDTLVVAGQIYEPMIPKDARVYAEELLDREPPGVMWLGRRSDMPELYAAADLVVVPSVWPEPFARAVLEGMASGRPVVASAVGGVPEMLAPPLDRFLVPPGDAHALAEAIDGVRDWRRKEPGLGAFCRQTVLDRFTLDHHLDAVEEVFSRAVARSRSSRAP